MPKKVEYRGSCSTCNNAPTCTFPRDPDRPVLQCEEFESYQPPPPKAVEKEDSLFDTTVGGGGAEKNTDPDRLIGLCRTCEVRESCIFIKSEVGVFHCEEYQ